MSANGLRQHSAYIISKDIPVSPRGRGSGPHEKYPINLLDVGESFAVPAGEKPERMRRSLISCALGRKNGRKYVTRRLVEDGVVVIRMWRIA